MPRQRARFTITFMSVPRKILWFPTARGRRTLVRSCVVTVLALCRSLRLLSSSINLLFFRWVVTLSVCMTDCSPRVIVISILLLVRRFRSLPTIPKRLRLRNNMVNRGRAQWRDWVTVTLNCRTKKPWPGRPARALRRSSRRTRVVVRRCLVLTCPCLATLAKALATWCGPFLDLYLIIPF